MAALFEAGRSREAAIELKRRVYDVSGGLRLDTSRGRSIYSQPPLVRLALGMQTRAGFLLASSALSHHMVKAMLAGEHFDAAHPLSVLASGKLDWDYGTAMHDPATMATVTGTELDKPIYQTRDYARDLPRYCGMAIADVLAAPLVDAFPGSLVAQDAINSVLRRRQAQGKPIPNAAMSQNIANCELLRSVLKSIDAVVIGPDTDWRAGIVDAGPDDVELTAFDRRNKRHAGTGARTGEAVRRRAAKLRKKAGSPETRLQKLVNAPREWGVASDDRHIVAVLTGKRDLPGLTPLAQTFMPAIWFRPAIDAPIHDWIARGSPMGTALALSNVTHAGLIAREVEAVCAAMPALFGLPLSSALRSRILVPMWTGLAGITTDHAHVR